MPQREGNEVDLVVDGPACRAALLEVIASAEQRLHLASFILRPDGAGDAVADALSERARAGVAVRVLLDPTQSRSQLLAAERDEGSPRRLMAELLARLRSAGVAVRAMRPGGRRPAALGAPIDHRKLVVADGAHALLPSFGIADSYLYAVGAPEGRARWHDAATVVTGPVVADLDAVFRAAWRDYGGEDPGALPGPRPTGDHTVELIDVAHPTRSDALHRLYRDRLPALAEHRLMVENPYVADLDVLEGWAAVARRRPELAITVIRPHPRFTDYVPPRAPAASRLARWVVRRHDDLLLGAGIDVREVTRSFVHLKLAAVDDRLAVHGSYNLTYRSAHLDREIALVIEGPTYPARVARLLAADAAAAEPASGDEPPLPRGTRHTVAWAADRLQRRLG